MSYPISKTKQKVKCICECGAGGGGGSSSISSILWCYQSHSICLFQSYSHCVSFQPPDS